jgi:nitrite reductase/ring-hydroxylating ferredoxin subunit
VAKYVVGREVDLPPGHRLIVDVAGRSIGVFNVRGQLYAVRNRCPHQGGPLCEGGVVGWLDSPGPGVFDYRGDRPILECPWHGWEFELETGQSWFDPEGTRVKRYDVEVETYEVGVEDRNIVVHIGG